MKALWVRIAFLIGSIGMALIGLRAGGSCDCFLIGNGFGGVRGGGVAGAGGIIGAGRVSFCLFAYLLFLIYIKYIYY